MQQNSPPPIPIPGYLPELGSDSPRFPGSDPNSSPLFDWSDFIDFNLDEAINGAFPQLESGTDSGRDWTQLPENPGRVRKRDPRLVCSNFLAGRVPCACPELDEKLEEESGLPGKKRVRMVRASGGGRVCCQVPGCEADITELKGYHKRHRVCLQCANAGTVVLDGESKRYCQQCGKFHLLSDFDEGKRSCRRKLEWHNRRRRRKSNESKGVTEKEAEQILTDDISVDNDTGKDDILVSNQIEERETLLESSGHAPMLCSALGSENIQGHNNFASFAASGEMHIDGQKQNSKYSHSPTYHDNKNTYSSPFPAGRISFKLYDWNPAEFPRRLRLQIFQWLASMPIELEGYIRPGCTILTAFISMPRPMWLKLLKEPPLCLKDLIASPGNMLLGRGTMLVYLGHMVFRVTKDAKSVLKIEVKDRAPKLHYIYPSCFEAGRPMEFIACGSDLLQPKFRFLVSFAGRYLAYNIRVSPLCCNKKDNNRFKHQVLKITVPYTDKNHFGPAFIEVENQSGISNFIPILIGDKETCAEMDTLQRKFDTSFSEELPSFPPMSSCQVFASRQAQFSDFVLDLAWSLKKPESKQQLTSSHVLRFNHLLIFLMDKESHIVLEQVLCSLNSAIDNNLVAGTSDAAMRSLRTNMEIARDMLDLRLHQKRLTVIPTPDANSYILSNMEIMKNMLSESKTAGESVPFLKDEVVMNVDLQPAGPRESCRRLLTRALVPSQQLVVAAVAAVCLCCAVCTVILHPHDVGRIATTIRRCLFDGDR